MVDGPNIRAQLRDGMQAAIEYGVRGPDTLCCGNCGRIDILVTAGRRLSDQHLCDRAVAHLSGVIRRSIAVGGFSLGVGDRAERDPVGIFKGLAGIAYTCLRLTDHDNVLPSLLLLG
jgi:lantibiotic modifying enzyme